MRASLLFVGACGFSGSDLPAAVDAPIAIDTTAPRSCESWTPAPHHFDPCAIGMPTTSLELSTPGTYTYDTTGNGTLTAPGGNHPPHKVAIVNGALVVDVEMFTLGTEANLSVIGDKPLIIAAWDRLVINGQIDVGSHAGSPGAGATATLDGCDAAVGENDGVGGGSGGGGGGGFQGMGGTGGLGDDDLSPNKGGHGGARADLPAFPRAGCAGANSGHIGSFDNTVAIGGRGGGALQLTSRVSIQSSGQLSAGGEGGAGQKGECGGGGGGSGGYLGFEAPMISLAGTIAANGGGGAGSNHSDMVGASGGDGGPSPSAAMGGMETDCSKAGGAGSSMTLEGESASTTKVPCGGGGGGGGAGYVVVFGSFTGQATVIPKLTVAH